LAKIDFMIRFLQNFPLKKYNTFGIDVKAKYFFEFTEIDDLVDYLNVATVWKSEKMLFLGSGSNLLFLNDFDGLVIHPNIPGIKLIDEDRNHVWLEVGAGVNWDDLVEFAVFHGWGGIENLSLIPGKVGAVAVQNIGAYGVEVQCVIETVKGFDLEKMKFRSISSSECHFAYRDSVFKNELKDQFLVTTVVFVLEKFPEFQLEYGDLKTDVEKIGLIDLQNIRKAVMTIRRSKLPDSEQIGNAGSFFKNPIVDKPIADKLKKEYGQIPLYPVGEGKTKLAAGWLIEQCGWKGYRDGDAGVHERQALILVNYGNATGQQIFTLSEKIQKSVLEKFGVDLEREVNVIS